MHGEDGFADVDVRKKDAEFALVPEFSEEHGLHGGVLVDSFLPLLGVFGYKSERYSLWIKLFRYLDVL